MDMQDVGSTFVNAEILDTWLQDCELSEEAESIKVWDRWDPLDYEYISNNQITVIRRENDQEQILTYNSAQNYFQSEKALVMNNPELAETVRVAQDPLKAGQVSIEDFIDNVHEWNTHKINVAFRANWLKFSQNVDLANTLLSTGNRILVSRNTSWGLATEKILMVIREALRRRAEPLNI